jgi:hypothetical protein
MPTALALQYVLQLLNLLPSLIATGQSVMATVNQGTTALQNMIAEKRDPTAEEWAALDKMRDALHQQVQSP